MSPISFSKYHALGNDYLVLEPRDYSHVPDAAFTVRVCHRNFGLGSDGILYGPLPSTQAQFGLRIFNPDGSEAEKSGNGLRIFAKYLYDTGLVDSRPFTVETPGGVVTCEVRPGGTWITVEMGRVSFDAGVIPVLGVQGEVIHQEITVGGRSFHYCAATVGNPHCVLPLPEVSEALAREFGPLLEVEPRFPRRTNVQFLQVLDRNNIRIEIWERGAGYTLASGSSSSAAGAVAKRLGLVDEQITVHMPGGQIELRIDAQFNVVMTGPATRVGAMQFDKSSLA